MNLKTILIAGAALVLGLLAGYTFGNAPRATAETGKAEPTAKTVRTPIEDMGDRASMRALRRRIRELEQEVRLAQQDADDTTGTKTNAVSEVQPGGDWFRRGQERMERLKLENPERYAEITNRMARFRRDRLELAQSQLNFLDSIDTTRMSASAKTLHEQLKTAIVQREELEEKFHQDDLPAEERELVMQDMRAKDHLLRMLNQGERSNLIRQTVESIGFQGDDAGVLVETINDIIRNTDGRRNGPGGRHGGGRRH